MGVRGTHGYEVTHQDWLVTTLFYGMLGNSVHGCGQPPFVTRCDWHVTVVLSQLQVRLAELPICWWGGSSRWEAGVGSHMERSKYCDTMCIKHPDCAFAPQQKNHFVLFCA